MCVRGGTQGTTQANAYYSLVANSGPQPKHMWLMRTRMYERVCMICVVCTNVCVASCALKYDCG